MIPKLATALLAGLCLAVGIAAPAGEPAAPAQPQVDEARLAELPAATVGSDLVAIVKIAAIAEVPADKAAWGGRDELLDASFARGQFGGQAVVRQVTAEVEKTLKGSAELKKVAFRLATAKVRLGKAPPGEVVAIRGWYNSGKFGARRARALTYARYRLAEGGRVLVFLKDVTAPAAGAAAGERQFLLVDPPMDGVSDQALARVSQTLKEIADWEKPPAPPAELAAAARKFVAELGSADYPTREAATVALIAQGLPVKAVIDEAVRSSDVEVRERAKRILEAIKPAALKPRTVEPDDVVDVEELINSVP